MASEPLRLVEIWHASSNIRPASFVCGHCDRHIGSSNGYQTQSHSAHIYICSFCGLPTFIWNGIIVPRARIGESVRHLPADVDVLYAEARDALAAGATTCAVMACRKLLMNLAVNKGADKNKRFVEYVDWLADNHWVPPNGKHWVTEIKDGGNEANHEIHQPSAESAGRLLGFTGMLLRYGYELDESASPKP